MGMGAELAVSSFLNFRSADFGLDKLFGWTKGKGLVSTALHLVMPAHEGDNSTRPQFGSAVAEQVSGRIAAAVEAVVAQHVSVTSGIVRSDVSAISVPVNAQVA